MGMTCSVGPHSVSTDIAVLLAHGTTTDCLVMSLTEVVEGQYYSFPEEVLKLWEEIDAFGEQLRRTEGRPEFVFYDGPPFATGLPHYGHLLAGTIKDIVTRYASTTGRHVVRRFGWDCHGLPVEHEIDKKLKISGKSDVMKLGIAKYNEECRSIVLRYSTEWKKTVTRIGRWIDFENDYKTMDPSFMESIWWVFKSLYEKNLVYKGFKVMPYSTACNTPLSNFEAGLDYRDVSDPAVTVTFPILECELRASLVAWTTTPWTLPSNVALCVHPELKYVYVKDPKDNVYVVAEARLESLPGAIKKCKENKKTLSDGWSVIKTVNGKSLSGLSYEPVFDWFKESMMQKQAFKVCVDTYVTDDSGTGIVHQAPAYGEDDYRVCLANGIIQKDAVLPDPVDANGCFMEPAAAAYLGVYIKDADKLLIQEVKERGRLIENARIVHSYPFCWRSQTPLIYRAVASYFVKVADIKDRLVANNLLTRWVPSYVQEKRFHNWLENAHDWAISRNRYWGTPIPVWSSPAGDESIIVGSIAELEKLTGKVVTDLHRHFIDDLEIPSQRGPEFPALRRIEDVFDCWFESGSMPYAQQHYPFESKQSFEDAFPADFVAEGLDQTRGWFYTLMVLSTALFDKPAFKNLICNGLVLAADGKKMSKSLKNYPDPTAILDKYGADALRLYLIDSPVVRAEPLRFKEEGVFGVLKDVFLPWYNAYRFLVQNILAFEETSGKFVPTKCDTVNVLDIWILSSTNSLVKFVTEEMSSYRLYTVVPKLISFISQLTNIYVRYNRGRLKGKDGVTESRTALNVLYHVSMTLCKTMAPFTPFFTENMYRNLRRCLPNSEESVHFCEFPTYDETSSLRIEASVSKMQAMIETARAVREKVGKPLKMPISKMTLVDDDVEFLHDAQNELLPYIKDELNIRCLEVSSNAAAFASLRAEPNFATLGKRLGKSMKRVADQIKTWDQEKIISFQTTQAAVEDGHELTGADVIIKYEFTQEGSSDSAHATIGARGMIVLDLRVDDSLLYSGAARLLVNRVQKLRKTVGLRTNDAVGLLYVLTGHTKNNFVSEMLRAEEEYIVSSLGGLPTVQCDRVHVIFGSDEFEISEGVFMRIFAVRPSPKMESLRVQGESKADEILQLVLAHDSTALQTELSTGEGKEFQLNGQTIRIVQRR